MVQRFRIFNSLKLQRIVYRICSVVYKIKIFHFQKYMLKIFQLESKSFESNFSNDRRKLNRLFNSSRITLNHSNILCNLSDSTNGSTQSNQIFFVPFNKVSNNISPKTMAAVCGGIMRALLPWHIN